MISPERLNRLQFLSRVVQRELLHLTITDQRIFSTPLTSVRAAALADNIDESERVEAFVSRFGRLQDTVGDKFLPLYLEAMGERPGAVIDNLDRAEKLQLIPSADAWLTMRKLRNQMVHEYIEDAELLADALQAGHAFVPTLRIVVENILAGLRTRGWLDA